MTIIPRGKWDRAISRFLYSLGVVLSVGMALTFLLGVLIGEGSWPAKAGAVFGYLIFSYAVTLLLFENPLYIDDKLEG